MGRTAAAEFVGVTVSAAKKSVESWRGNRHGRRPERLGAALAVERAPSLERRQGHDSERLHGVPLAHAAVDHGRGGGDLLLVCAPGLLAVHG